MPSGPFPIGTRVATFGSSRQQRTLYQPPPGRFEAGTGNIADAVGLGAALKYLQTIGMPNIERYETELLAYATPRLQAVPGLTIVGTAAHKASVLSFVVDGIDPVTIGSILNQDGIAVRAGHQCAQPILRPFGYEATVRAALAFYNTCQEVDALVRVLYRLVGAAGSRARLADELRLGVPGRRGAGQHRRTTKCGTPAIG